MLVMLSIGDTFLHIRAKKPKQSNISYTSDQQYIVWDTGLLEKKIDLQFLWNCNTLR